MTLSNVERTALQYRALVLSRDKDLAALMRRRYAGVIDRLRVAIQEAAADIAAAQAAGNAALTEQRLYQLARYQAFLASARAEVNGYASWAAEGIARDSARAAQIGLEAGAETVQAAYLDAGRVVGGFQILPAEAVAVQVGYTAAGTPLGELIAAIYAPMADALTSALVTGVAVGSPVREIAREMAALMADHLGLPLKRALTIARTEVLRSYRTANQQQMSALDITRYIRRCALSDRTCAACLALDGQIYDNAEAFRIHPNCRCVVPGMIVSGVKPDGFSARYYEGDVITIRTSSGKFLTVTPNHPILTDRGWIIAELVQKGDNVIRSLWADREKQLVDPNNYYAQSLIEDVPLSLGMDPLISMPTAAEDFHGDGSGSNIHVIFSNSHLRNNGYSALAQKLSEILLVLGNIRRLDLTSGGSGAQTFIRRLLSEKSFMGLYSPDSQLLGSSVIRNELVSLTYSACRNPVFDQGFMHERPGHSELFSQSVFADPGSVQRNNLTDRQNKFGSFSPSFLSSDAAAFLKRSENPASLEFIREALLSDMGASGSMLGTLAVDIELDRVLEISVSTFAGHVYNLQNKVGWYNVNSIITHNCFMVPILPGITPTQMLSGKDWFFKQSEATQLAIVGRSRLDWLNSGGDFKQLAALKRSPVWGPTVRLRSVKELQK